jgi:ribose transport system substrate-binding protein
MTRKSIRIATVFAVAATLIAGCANDDGSEGGSESTGGSGGEAIQVAYVLPSLDNQAYKAGVDAMRAAVEEDGNIDFQVYAGKAADDATQQITNLRTAVAKDADAIIVLPTDPAVLSKPLQTLASDTPVVAVGAEIPDFELDGLVLFPDRTGGELAGRYLAENVEDGSSIGILHCQPGNPVLDQRVSGAKSEWTEKNFEIAATLDAKCDNATGRAVMTDMLTAHPDLDAVFSVSDSQTIGALRAVKVARKDPFFVSYDAQPAALQKVKSGELDGTVDIQIPRGAAEAIPMAAKLARGQTIASDVINVPPRMATPENVEQILAELGGASMG